MQPVDTIQKQSAVINSVIHLSELKKIPYDLNPQFFRLKQVL